MRVAPPDRLQAEAIMDIIDHFNWTYISLLYSEGSYGENGGKQIEKQAEAKGVCIAYSKKIPSLSDEETFQGIITDLKENYKARVLVLVLEVNDANDFFIAITRNHLENYFVFLGMDGIYGIQPGPVSHGLIALNFKTSIYKPFANYYRYLTPRNATFFPWMGMLWESYYNCSLDGLGKHSCSDFLDMPYADEISPWTSKIHDAVQVYALALHKLISDQCPDAFIQPRILKSCVKGELLLSYMKNTTFYGTSGKVEFDENGDSIGQYDIFQCRYNYKQEQCHYMKTGDWISGKLTLDAWEPFLYTEYTQLPYGKELISTEMPQSLCSKQCLPKQYKIQKKLHCCWSCLYCQRNEIVVNGTECATCPETTWPDELTATWCENIEPSYMRYTDTMAICLLLVTIICILAAIVIFYLFYRNRSVKLIKASGRELIAVMTGGIFMAYVVVFAFIAKPTTASCYTSHFGFNLSVTLIYAPLLLKTNRVHRIFVSGKKGMQGLRFISTLSQMITVAILFCVQVSKTSLYPHRENN